MDRPGLTIFTDGFSPGTRCHCLRRHLERPQDPYGLGPGGTRRRVRSDCEGSQGSNQGHAYGTVTIFTDAQAVIWRMTSDDPDPDKYAIMARKHIAALRAKNRVSASRFSGAVLIEGRRVGQAGRWRTGCPRSGVARLQGPVGHCLGETHSAPEVPC